MDAPGYPGLEPRWTTGAKDAIGTAVQSASSIWFTLAHGIVTEVYFPSVDTASVRDNQLLVVSDDGGFWEEKRDLTHTIRYQDPEALAFILENQEPGGRFRIVKEIVTWPDGDALLQRIRFEAQDGPPERYRLFWLVAPHLGDQGAGNSARVTRLGDRLEILAYRESYHLQLSASVPFKTASVGYVGQSDGFTCLHRTGTLPVYEQALAGNIALTAELDLTGPEQVLVMGFGRTKTQARFASRRSLAEGFDEARGRYIAGWHGYLRSLPGLLAADEPHARMQHISAMVLRAHRAKLFSGAMIAALAIPWGVACGDGNSGGYHLVWPRDMVQSALALCAVGDTEGACQALWYLMATQQPDGSWPQNFWLDGNPYWRGSQLDETAFPIHLAYRLVEEKMLEPGPELWAMIRKALAYIAQNGPVTQEDRWEEDGGYSPFTLAACIAGLILGAYLLRQAGDDAIADYCEALGDYWAAQVDTWTFVKHGQALPGHPCHYERIHPVAGPDDPVDITVHRDSVPIRNLSPGQDPNRREGSVVDGGFLALVRYGIKAADDPHVVQSMTVYDALLEVRFPYGSLWHRYNGDGYGEQDDGSPFQGAGRGRAWPLLAGERGHYEVALGHDPDPNLLAMEATASDAGMIPEQVWDAPDIAERGLYFGRPAGSAMPLVWAHAEYLKLLRSKLDRAVCEQYRPVATRYQAKTLRARRVFWQFNHRRSTWPEDARWLRIAVLAPARLVYTVDGWRTTLEATLLPSGLGLFYTDIDLTGAEETTFTFFWTDVERWEGQNFTLTKRLVEDR